MGCPNAQLSADKSTVFPLRMAFLFLVVGFSIADSCNFIINLVIFHAISDARVARVTWLCDKELL